MESNACPGGCLALTYATDHLDDLRIQAQYARERYRLYKARTLGQRPTSSQRLRELQRAYEQEEARLRFAQAHARRARGGGEHQHDAD
jgi:hypothetical protein